jgi:NitT/TauT family transport system substrate-binding protein
MSPKMMQTVMIVTVDYAKSHPDIVRSLVAGRREGLAYLAAHPDEAGDIVAKAYNNPDKALFRREIASLLKDDYWSDGKLDYDAMNHMVEGLRITGQLKGDVDWARIVDTSFLPPDQHAAR